MPKTSLTGSAKAKKPAAPNLSMQEQIALRAYHIYLQRNGAPGNPFEDWTRAEREIHEEINAKPKAKPRRKSNVTSIAA
jgi:hypothetical protein